MNTLKQTITALALTLCILSAAVIITLNFRPLFYMDMNHYHLSEATGYSNEEIRQNYNALIDYNSVFYRGNLEFPTLPMSEPARIHFEEVKRIFVVIQLMFPITLVISFLGIWSLKKQKPAYLKLTSILTLALPALLGILIGLNWDQFFIKFHELFFNNDYWIFNEDTDPIILLLPDGFFMHCALTILGLIIIGCLVCFFLYRRKTGRSGINRPGKSTGGL